jgi:hypothetical protein
MVTPLTGTQQDLLPAFEQSLNAGFLGMTGI